jgi:hypothetical protein
MTLIKNNIRLLSIHIPKTAGSSFQKTLESIYGNEKFMRLDFTLRPDVHGLNITAKNQTDQSFLDKISSEQSLSSSIEVLHGHIHFSDFINSFEIHPELKVITWLRDPYERIVSNYNYLHSVFESDVKHTPKSRKIFKRLVMSIADFAKLPRDVKMYSDYLSGQRIEDYTFIGLVEEYNDELKRLSKTMDWSSTPTYFINKTSNKSITPTSEEAEIIRKYCESNQVIYDRPKY